MDRSIILRRFSLVSLGVFLTLGIQTAAQGPVQAMTPRISVTQVLPTVTENPWGVWRSGVKMPLDDGTFLAVRGTELQQTVTSPKTLTVESSLVQDNAQADAFIGGTFTPQTLLSYQSYSWTMERTYRIQEMKRSGHHALYGSFPGRTAQALDWQEVNVSY